MQAYWVVVELGAARSSRFGEHAQLGVVVQFAFPNGLYLAKKKRFIFKNGLRLQMVMNTGHECPKDEYKNKLGK